MATESSTSASDLPAERGASGKLKWILLALALVVIVAVALFRVSLSFSTPPAARETAQKFLDALARGDDATAGAMCKRTADLDGLGRVAREIRTWGAPQNQTSIVGMRRKPQGEEKARVDFSDEVDYANLHKTYTVTVVQMPAGDWQVDTYGVN